MKIWLLAWDNLRFSRVRTIIAILVISLAVTSIMVFRGYVNYSAEGMKIGFISQTGAIQIAHKDFWLTTTETLPLLQDKEEIIITNILENTYGIKDYLKLLSINGIVGTGYRSNFFGGDAYEKIPAQMYSLIDTQSESAVNPNGIILGTALAEFLGVSAGTNNYVSLLSMGQDGMAFISLPISGVISVNNRQADKILSIMSLETAQYFYGMTNEFDRMRVDIVNINDLEKIKDHITTQLQGTSLEVRDWIELNPTYTEVNKLNDALSFWATFILVMFVLTAITQTLYMSYWQRMNELGTLRAIGITPYSVFGLLLRETFIMALLGCLFGVLLTYTISYLTVLFNITFTPPFAMNSYPLRLFITIKDIIIVNLLIIITTIFSGLYPAYKAVSQPVVEVMKNV